MQLGLARDKEIEIESAATHIGENSYGGGRDPLAIHSAVLLGLLIFLQNS